MNKVEIILHKIQLELGLNKSQLADYLGYGRSSITSWIKTNNISKKAKLKLNTDFSIQFLYLDTGEGPFYEIDSEKSETGKRVEKRVEKALGNKKYELPSSNLLLLEKIEELEKLKEHHEEINRILEKELAYQKRIVNIIMGIVEDEQAVKKSLKSTKDES